MKMTVRERRNLRNGLLFTSPWIFGVLCFTIIPGILSIYYSFCDYSVLNPPTFVGLENYRQLMEDEVFWLTLRNTFIFAAMALPTGTFLSVALALLLNAKIVMRPIFRTIFFLPSLVPLVALAVLWGWLFNPAAGLLNIALGKLGLEPINWLGEVKYAKIALIIAGLWGVGNGVVIYLAGLQDVPASLYEAARIDGANWWQQTWHVTLPMISPVIYFNLLMGCIGVLQVFALPKVMTGGGPARSTYFYTMYLFDQAFTYFNMGYASAMAWILFILIAVLTWGAHMISKRHVHYGAN